MLTKPHWKRDILRHNFQNRQNSSMEMRGRLKSPLPVMELLAIVTYCDTDRQDFLSVESLVSQANPRGRPCIQKLWVAQIRLYQLWMQKQLKQTKKTKRQTGRKRRIGSGKSWDKQNIYENLKEIIKTQHLKMKEHTQAGLRPPAHMYQMCSSLHVGPPTTKAGGCS